MSHYDAIRPDIIETLRNYADRGTPTGGFLRACLANDFMEAIGTADDDNRRTLSAIAAYIYNELPGTCHGSYKIVDEWIDGYRRQREALSSRVEGRN